MVYGGLGVTIVQIVNFLFTAIVWIVIANAILSWLVAFNVVNPRNAFVYRVGRFLESVTDPLLRPIRSVVPVLGGVDISPIVLILAIWLARGAFNSYAAPALFQMLG